MVDKHSSVDKHSFDGLWPAGTAQLVKHPTTNHIIEPGFNKRIILDELDSDVICCLSLEMSHGGGEGGRPDSF